MIGKDVEQLIIKIGGDISGFKKAVKGIKRENKGLEGSMKAMGKVAGASFLAIASTATALGVTAFKTFSEFETGITNVAKTTNLAGQDLEDFKTGIMDLSEEIPITTDKLNEIATSAGQLGIQGKENLLSFTKTIALLGETTDIEGGDAALALARILNLTNENAESAGNFASALVHLGNNLKTNEGQILEISKEVAKSVVQFDLSSTSVLAMSGAMAELGIAAEAGSTVIGKSFQAIDNAINEGTGPAFEKLVELTGITGDNLKQTFETDANEVFLAFLKGLQKADKGGAVLKDELEAMHLSGIRVNKILPTMALRLGTVDKAYKLAGEGAKDMSKINAEAAKKFETSASKMKMAQSKLNNMMIDVGAKIAPALNSAIEEMADVIVENKGAIEGLGKAFGIIALGAVRMVAAVDKAIKWVVGGVTGAIESVVTAVSSAVDWVIKDLKKIPNFAKAIKWVVNDLKRMGDTVDPQKQKMLGMYGEYAKSMSKYQKDLDAKRAKEKKANEAAEAEAEKIRAAQEKREAKREKAAIAEQKRKDKEAAADKKRTEKAKAEADQRAKDAEAAQQKITDDAAAAADVRLEALKAANTAKYDQQVADDADMFAQKQSDVDAMVAESEREKFEIEEIDSDKWDDLTLAQQEAYIKQVDAAIAHSLKTGDISKAADLTNYKNKINSYKKEETSYKEFLKDLEKQQEKHGMIQGTLIAMQNTTQYGLLEDGLGAMAELRNSSDSRMKEVGKAATIVQIGMSTAESSMKAFNGLAWIPYVGIPLGVAAASAVALYGTEKINKVRQMKTGGIVSNIVPGVGTGDKVPAMLEPGELILPVAITREVLKRYKKARRMSKGGYVDAKEQKDGLQKTFYDTFSVPKLFLQIISGEAPDSKSSGFGAQDIGSAIPAMIADFENAAEQLEYALYDAMPGGDLLKGASKEVKKFIKEARRRLGHNVVTDALTGIIDNSTGAATGIIKGVGGAFHLKNGGVVGMLEPGEMRLSKNALSALATSVNMDNRVSTSPIIQMSGGVPDEPSRQIVGVEIFLNDNVAEVVNAQIREGSLLGTINPA